MDDKTPGKAAKAPRIHVHEGDVIDEALVADWIRQAAALPGEGCF